MPNYKLTLCYDGSRYNGWQKQGNTQNTIQEKLEKALSGILGQPVEAAGSGRTDAGVHAQAQTVSFHADAKLSAFEILTKLRSVLPEDIGAVSLEEAPPRFHARLSCIGKTYLYRVWNSDTPCVFERKYLYRFCGELNLDAMRQAASFLCGEHDFAAFSTGHTKKSTVRTVDEIRIDKAGPEIRFFFSGDGFLYNMVRIMAGTLLEVGAGRMSCARLADALSSRSRAQAGPTAPARGLCLLETRY